MIREVPLKYRLGDRDVLITDDRLSGFKLSDSVYE
jgi:hypothetical protein